ncbi:MAG TPA: PaaI family thioesterase [Dongiaceae bacterium]|nr:PaaI family thioesterase [Dongiaceae bacterium]
MSEPPHTEEPPFHDLIGARRRESAHGRAVYDLTVGPQHLNRRGVAHGGVVSALLDMALGTAVVSAILPEEWCGTMQLSVQFREPVLPGAIVAEGRMARRGRTAAFAEGEVRDARGTILATAHGVWTIWPSRPPAPRPRPAQASGQ